MDIIVLTIIITCLFIVTSLGPLLFQEYSIKKQKNPDLIFVDFLTRLITDVNSKKNTTLKEKKLIHKKIVKTISDMETDGVYFSDEIKDKLKKTKENSICEYSGLPSVESYLTNNQKSE